MEKGNNTQLLALKKGLDKLNVNVQEMLTYNYGCKEQILRLYQVGLEELFNRPQE